MWNEEGLRGSGRYVGGLLPGGKNGRYLQACLQQIVLGH